MNITASAYDPDDDLLTFTINDTRFTKIGLNSFIWETSLTDAGTYDVLVEVTDGYLSDEQIVTIFV